MDNHHHLYPFRTQKPNQHDKQHADVSSASFSFFIFDEFQAVAIGVNDIGKLENS